MLHSSGKKKAAAGNQEVVRTRDTGQKKPRLPVITGLEGGNGKKKRGELTS